jgi:hypothetical protein
MGETMLPFFIDPNTDFKNRENLIQRLNEPDVFDVDLHPQNKDRLQVSFSCPSATYNRLTYGFVFKKGKWFPEEYDCLEWQWKHIEEHFGKMKNAIERL